MAEAIIRGLIGLCLLVAAVWLVLYVVGMLGIMIPPMVVTIVWIIVMLIAVLILIQMLRPYIGGFIP